MSQELQRLVELARTVAMSPTEQEEQRINFAFGNVRFESQTLTREDVVRASKRLKEHHEQTERPDS